MKEGTWAGIIAFGDPKDDDLTIFCQEADDGGAGSYEAKVTIGMSGYPNLPWLFSYNDTRERFFYTCFGENSQMVPMDTASFGEEYSDYVTHDVRRARCRARQVRFEHGQAPIIRRRKFK